MVVDLQRAMPRASPRQRDHRVGARSRQAYHGLVRDWGMLACDGRLGTTLSGFNSEVHIRWQWTKVARSDFLFQLACLTATFRRAASIFWQLSGGYFNADC